MKHADTRHSHSTQVSADSSSKTPDDSALCPGPRKASERVIHLSCAPGDRGQRLGVLLPLGGAEVNFSALFHAGGVRF